MKKEHFIWLGIGVLVGMAANSKLRSLPLLNKVPSV